MTMIETKLPKVGTTIFSVMSQLAVQHQAVNLGQGFPELGYVRFSELAETKNRLGINLERDLFFIGTYPLSVYAEAARAHERITEDEQHLKDAAKRLGLSEIPQT